MEVVEDLSWAQECVSRLHPLFREPLRENE